MCLRMSHESRSVTCQSVRRWRAERDDSRGWKRVPHRDSRQNKSAMECCNDLTRLKRQGGQKSRLGLFFCLPSSVHTHPTFGMQEFGLSGSTLVALGRTVSLLRETLTLDNCVHALETVAGQLRNLTVLMPHGGLGELILDGYVYFARFGVRLQLCAPPNF